MDGTIKENRDFRRAYRRGVCYPSGVVVTYVFMRKSGGFRIGVTVGKKLGNAVARNRARRVIRAAWRAVEPDLVGSADVVFVARSRTPACKSAEIARVLQGQMRAAGLLREGGRP